MRPLLVIMLAILLEVFVLVQVADAIGGWTTFALVIASSCLGVVVIRSAWRRWRSAGRKVRASMTTGPDGMPMASSSSVDPRTWTDPALVLIAGVFLLIPGLVTSVVGLILLVPMARRGVLMIAGPMLARRFNGTTNVWQQVRIRGGGVVVEGEVIDDGSADKGT